MLTFGAASSSTRPIAVSTVLAIALGRFPPAFGRSAPARSLILQPATKNSAVDQHQIIPDTSALKRKEEIRKKHNLPKTSINFISPMVFGGFGVLRGGGNGNLFFRGVVEPANRQLQGKSPHSERAPNTS
jgi:hypothetical protein